MDKRSALLIKNINCPICKRGSDLVRINPRLYVAADRESDMHVTSYRWGEKIPGVTPPHYFAVWQCPQCLFADLADSIEKPAGTIKEDQLHESYLKSSRQQRALVHELRTLVPEDDLDFRGALALHLAALYIASLPPKEHIDHNKLGRLALRVGWLFREGGDVTVSTAAAGDDTMSRLQAEVESMQSQLAEIGSTLGGIGRYSQELAAELGLEKEEDNPYSSVAASMIDKYEEIRTLLTTLQRAVIRDRQGSIKPGASSGKPTTDSLAEFLLPLRSHWPKLPSSEEEGLRIAIEALDHSYREETAFSSIEQSMKAVHLIIDLLCRVGDQERALKYIAEVYKSGMRSINELSRRVKTGRQSGTLKPHDEKMIRRKMGTIQLSIQQAGETRRDLFEVLYTRHEKVIADIAHKAKGKTPMQIEKMLAEAGIPEEMFSYLKTKGLVE